MQLEKHGYPLVLGHRGASGYAPENTLYSFEKAIEMKADGVELDVQLTKDGVSVVVHDEWLERVSNGTGFIKDHTLEELKKLNFNKMHPEYEYAQIPTFKEVLALIKPSNLIINIELKTAVFNYPGIVDIVMNEVKEFGMEDRVIYSSFNHYTCIEILEKDPNAYVGFLYQDLFIDVAEYVKAHGGRALHPAMWLLLDLDYMKKANELGLDVNAWTINEEEQMELGCKIGLTSIITNYPDKALKIVEKYK